MIERDKEYYNQKISELYAVIENQEKIIRDLQEDYNNELDENLKLSELWLKSQEENRALKETIKQLYRQITTSDMSEEEWLDYAIKYNLEQLEKKGNNE